MKKPSSDYKAEDIFVLEGLEPVRKRPGMYIGSTGTEGFHHLVWECVDNAIDEAIAGFCSEILVEILSEDKIKVQDNGRGIPIEIHPQTKKSALETVMTYLHSGAKFGGKVYRVSGGLHGVGISVVNALSEWMRVEVERNGKKYFQEYKRGKPTTPVKEVGNSKRVGSTIIFKPDPLIFKKQKFSFKKIVSHLREQAYLVPSLLIKIIDKREKPERKYAFFFEGGVKSFLRYLLEGERPIQEEIFYFKKEVQNVEIESALCWTEDVEEEILSFANNVATKEGGTHLSGFKRGLTKAIQKWAREQKIIKNEKIEGEDVREGLTAIISVRIPEPEFEGQTKQRLGNPEVKSIVEKVISEEVWKFFEKNPSDAKKIIEKIKLAAKAREAAKAAKETVLKRGLFERLSLPGKLADCISKNPEKRELFIVEGESAGGSSKQARDRNFQAILPIKGKILNVEKVHLNKALTSKEIKSIILALGTSIAKNFDFSRLRYHKIVIMCDADSDGNHIRTLLLTLFFRYFKPVIEKGYLFVAQPPLYRVQAGKKVYYAWSDEEKEKILKKEKNGVVQRFKGLGEMNPTQLWETTMDPKKRILKKITIEDAKEADKMFDILMGKDVLPRKKFITSFAKEAKNLDI